MLSRSASGFVLATERRDATLRGASPTTADVTRLLRRAWMPAPRRLCAKFTANRERLLHASAFRRVGGGCHDRLRGRVCVAEHADMPLKCPTTAKLICRKPYARPLRVGVNNTSTRLATDACLPRRLRCGSPPAVLAIKFQDCICCDASMPESVGHLRNCGACLTRENVRGCDQ